MAWCNLTEDDDIADDYLDWSDDDDVCHSKYVISSSSDEDGEKFLERLKSKKLVKKAAKSDGKDDFEREMASELSMTMQQLTASIYSQSSTAGASSSKTTANADKSKSCEKPSEFYDEIYFDSDDSDGEEVHHKASSANKSSNSTRKKNSRRILSNDELFYDPKMDDRDQAWMDKMRRSYQVSSKKSSQDAPQASQKPLPESDAVLNCPACLTMLCMDCQRHEIYHNQYRAMFVFNCNIDQTEVLRFPKKNQKKKEFFKNKKKFKKTKNESEENSLNLGETSGEKEAEIPKSAKDLKEAQETSDNQGAEVSNQGSKDDCSSFTQNTSNMEVSTRDCEVVVSTMFSGNPEEHFHPVTCKICNTKVAVYDKDEVYHFFNIVTSY